MFLSSSAGVSLSRLVGLCCPGLDILGWPLVCLMYNFEVELFRSLVFSRMSCVCDTLACVPLLEAITWSLVGFWGWPGVCRVLWCVRAGCFRLCISFYYLVAYGLGFLLLVCPVCRPGHSVPILMKMPSRWTYRTI